MRVVFAVPRLLVGARLAAALSLALSAGCQSGVAPNSGSADRPAAAPAAAAARSAAVATAAPSPAAPPAEPATGTPPPDAAPAAPTHVALPRSPDKPVRRTTRPLTRAQLARLAADRFPDFDLQPRDATDRTIEFRQLTKTRPKLAVTVQLATCRPRTACPSMDVARWRARRAALMHELPASLRASRDLRFDIAAQRIAGAPVVTVYELGYASSDDQGQPAADYIDAFVVYYNDGVNQMRVMAHYVDDALGSAEHLLAIAPPEDLQKLAVSFASYYMHAW